MTNPIRVLQVFGALNRGGSESMIMTLYRKIDRSKIQFDFVKHTQDACSFDEEICSLGGKIYCAPKFKFYNYFSYRKWWKNFFLSHPEYRIVHGHLFTIASVFFDIAHKYNLVTIGHSHATEAPILNIKTLLRRPFLKKLEKTSDLCFACSNDAGNWIYKKKKFIVLKNAIDSEKYVYSEKSRNIIREELNLQNKFVIGNIGRLTAQKNQDFLLDVFKIVHNEIKESALLIVGSGELLQSLKNKAGSLGLGSSVIFTGVRSDVPTLLSAMDVFVFPSLWEGLGIVAVEAQAAGLHTLCSDVVPKEAKVTNLVEFLSLSDSAQKWADAILKYRFGYEKVNTYSEIVDAGYDIESTVKWLENFYANI